MAIDVYPAAVPVTVPVQLVTLPFSGGDDTAGGILAWQNPTAGRIWLAQILLSVTTPATGACGVDADLVATPSSNNSGNVMSNADVHTAAIPLAPLLAASLIPTTGSQINIGTGGATAYLDPGQWLVVGTHAGASAGLAGVVSVLYVPLG